MKPIPFWKLSVATTSEAEEAVSELLTAVFGLAAATQQNTITGRTVVSVFVPRRRDITTARRAELRAGLLRARESGLQVGSGRVSIRHVPAEDWTTSWKRHFKPWEPGKLLLVKPSWSQAKAKAGQATLVLDPGLSFGTGNHPTTRFCLRQLVRLRKVAVSQSLLDIGSGSGILSIGATLLGYAPVHAFDFDPEAVRVANANARMNGVQRRLRFEQADLARLPKRAAQRYDVVCANLMYDLLIAERQRILNRVANGGALILAGILVNQFGMVQKAFEGEGWFLERGRTEGEWRSGLFRMSPF
ncbi:MAG: 50S ribosomal protein L11 methyltransferase [Verrucomicrobiales bacterium]|nr:50S ribosomal protein L11 methyltransferase [Verrucomicrobiales bacterium]